MLLQFKGCRRSLPLKVILGWAVFSCGFIPAALASTTSAPTATAEAPIPVRRLEVRSPEIPELNDFEPFLPVFEQRVTHLVLKLGERRVYAYSGDEVLASYPVAIGKPETPTPTGEFAVFQMIENPVWQSPWTGEVHDPGPDSALGVRWIGFARMPNGVIGFHGTPTVSSIGHAASNGCVRMHNEDVLALFQQVEMGTPVTVEP